MAVHHEQSARCCFNFAAAPAADLMSTGTQLQSSLPPSAVATSTCSVGAITVGGNGDVRVTGFEDSAYFPPAPYHYQNPQHLLRYFHQPDTKDTLGATPPPPVPTFSAYDSSFDKTNVNGVQDYANLDYKVQRFGGLELPTIASTSTSDTDSSLNSAPPFSQDVAPITYDHKPVLQVGASSVVSVLASDERRTPFSDRDHPSLADSQGFRQCFACHQPITDRVLLSVNQKVYHAACLSCEQCSTSLDSSPTCFCKEDSVFCKQCYTQRFKTKCASCDRQIQPTDWVRRARQFVYHLACFSCDHCKRQLSTGEQFSLQDNRLLCRQHYLELVQGQECEQKQKTKRVRTTFGEEQLGILQAHFQIDSNPDGADLERIANLTGLSKRVTQVWFQNSRARQKKYCGTKKGARAGSGASANSSTASGPMNENGSGNGGTGNSGRSSTATTMDSSIASPKSPNDSIPEAVIFTSSITGGSATEDTERLISSSIRMETDALGASDNFN